MDIWIIYEHLSLKTIDSIRDVKEVGQIEAQSYLEALEKAKKVIDPTCFCFEIRKYKITEVLSNKGSWKSFRNIKRKIINKEHDTKKPTFLELD